MKKLLLVVILISLSYCNAQTGNRDSIKNLILNDKEDTTRVKDLANLSYEYIESNPDTMMIIALEGFTLSTKIGWEKGNAPERTKRLLSVFHPWLLLVLSSLCPLCVCGSFWYR